MPEKHKMLLKETNSSGVEEWYCPTCGRRFLLQWPPDYKKIILEPGDEYASNSGGKGDLQMGGLQVVPAEDDTGMEDPRLAPWLEWLESVDFDSLWDRGNQ